MKLLLGKKEANVPLYLQLACEELRLFGVFEEVIDSWIMSAKMLWRRVSR